MTNISWMENSEIPVELRIEDVNDNILDMGNAFRYLRVGDILFNPRNQEMVRVNRTPDSPNVEITEDWFGQYYTGTWKVAEYFGVSVSTIKRWCRLNIIPADKTKHGWQVLLMLISDTPSHSVIGDSLIILTPTARTT